MLHLTPVLRTVGPPAGEHDAGHGRPGREVLAPRAVVAATPSIRRSWVTSTASTPSVSSTRPIRRVWTGRAPPRSSRDAPPRAPGSCVKPTDTRCSESAPLVLTSTRPLAGLTGIGGAMSRRSAPWCVPRRHRHCCERRAGGRQPDRECAEGLRNGLFFGPPVADHVDRDADRSHPHRGIGPQAHRCENG